MAMTPAGLSAILHSELQSFFTIIDDSVLQKFCDACGIAIVTYIQDHADVVPAAHVGENLSSPTGQPVEVIDPDDGTLTGTTTADQEVVGKGSIV